NYTNWNDTSYSGPLNPGVYCGGITITHSTTFNPGLYVVKNGDLNISGTATDITANGVTFVLTGNGAGLNLKMSGTQTFSPMTSGQFAGFVFFLDQNPAYNPLSTSTIAAGKHGNNGAQMTMNGIVYLAGQSLVIGSGSGDKTVVTINPGSIIA